MDETGLFYHSIPNRSYVQAGQRRQARGTKALQAKDRVTLVLACNATGSHKIPVAFIGKVKQPRCFKPPRQACPVPYFSQNNAWMDEVIFKSWFETVFLPSVWNTDESMMNAEALMETAPMTVLAPKDTPTPEVVFPSVQSGAEAAEKPGFDGALWQVYAAFVARAMKDKCPSEWKVLLMD
eukprot:contig_17969_g4404